MDFQGVYAIFGPWILSFALALTRIGTLFITTPIFSMPAVPVSVKAGIVGALTILVMTTTQPVPELMALNTVELGGAIIMEAVLGGIMGLAVSLLFGALSFTGQLIGIQMGFAIANVVDPSTNQQNGILGQVLNLMALCLFLSFDGHLMLLRGLFESFHTVPLGAANPQKDLIIATLIAQGGEVFRVGLQIGLPVVCVVLLVNVGLATLARTVPQVNIFVIGFLITISVGMMVLSLAIPSTGQVLIKELEAAVETAVGLVRMF
jgi:flagellar biosynthesis protein FliR